MQLTWKASESASAMHAAHALSQAWFLAAPGLADALCPLVSRPPAAERGDLPRLLRMLEQQAATGVDHNRALAERTLTRMWGRSNVHDAEISSLAAWASGVERAYYDWYGGRSKTPLADEIVTRSRPLRDLWDARGPGMIGEMARLTDKQLFADRADVVMVLPVLGGHGKAHLATNTVTLEAVLTNADQSVPEVVRLAWLLGQLQFDLPAIADVLPPGEARQIAQIAMLAPTLCAAEEVELAEFSEPTLAHAAHLWRITDTPDEASRLAQLVWKWWSAYQVDRVEWPVAAAALERMLSGA